ncbi:hypothetical protein [Leptospira levettii]|uniref:hypothetical protein n=1 Tax=Leptospira levettii TaxID=2023178 RepID=UPI001083E5A2|nr:hypothetical protein [Leptospira levettii]TGL06738.1 hypothetical protein EHQ39_14880 [Leptospira levettii]
MKKVFNIMCILIIIQSSIFSESKKMSFNQFLTSLKQFHEQQIETFTSENGNPNTFPILFAIGKEALKQDFQKLDSKDPKVKKFITEYNQIDSNIKTVNQYIEFGNSELLTLIENTLPPAPIEYIGERTKINKIYWQLGDSSNWQDCPVNLIYHELLESEICAMNFETAERYCAQFEGRLPSIVEFTESYKTNKEIMQAGKWMKYWTSSKKDGNPQHITITEKFGTNIDGKSLSAVRCVWDKIK